MKVEQACRFRTETGYAICAKTSGFTAANEENLGKIFNDVMNPLMPKPGSSVVTFTTLREDAFLSRSTMRTDVSGRRSVFNHVYVFPAQNYRNLMREDPALCLSIPTDGMMTQQQKQCQLEPLELGIERVQGFDLDALRKKYRLDANRYAALLFLGYRAVISGSSLCLQVSRCPDPLTLVREITYCLAVGLVPMLRGRITYSSAADTRQTVCVQMPQMARIGTGAVVFPMDAAAPMAPIQMDLLSRRFFSDMAQMDDQSRAETLDRMEEWIAAVVGEQGVTPMLITAAYYFTAVQDWTNQETLTLLSSLTAQLQNPNAVSESMDHTVISLAQSMTEHQVRPDNMLLPLVKYAIYSPNEECRRSLQPLYQSAQPGAKLNLLNQLLDPQIPPEKDPIIRELLQNLPMEREQIPDELEGRLIGWIASSQQVQESYVVEFACRLLDKDKPEIWNQLVSGMVNGISARSPRDGELRIISHLLDNMSRDPARRESVLSESCCSALDAWGAAVGPDIQNSFLQYLFAVRMRRQIPMETRVQKLRDLYESQPHWFERVMAYLRATPECAPDLMESYQARYDLDPAAGKQELMRVCKNHPGCRPGGPFESKVYDLWYRESNQRIQAIQVQISLTGTIGELVEYIRLDHEQIFRLAVSDQIRLRLWTDDLERFWIALPYSALVQWNGVMPEVLFSPLGKQGNKKVEFLRAVRALQEENHSTEPLCRLMLQENLYTPAEYEEIRHAVLLLAERYLQKERILLIDLLLLSASEVYADKQEVEFSYEAIEDWIWQMEAGHAFDTAFRLKLSDSVLLSDEESRQKKVRKILARRKIDEFDRFIDEMKGKKNVYRKSEDAFEQNWSGLQAAPTMGFPPQSIESDDLKKTGYIPSEPYAPAAPPKPVDSASDAGYGKFSTQQTSVSQVFSSFNEMPFSDDASQTYRRSPIGQYSPMQRESQYPMPPSATPGEELDDKKASGKNSGLISDNVKYSDEPQARKNVFGGFIDRFWNGKKK